MDQIPVYSLIIVGDFTSFISEILNLLGFQKAFPWKISPFKFISPDKFQLKRKEMDPIRKKLLLATFTTLGFSFTAILLYLVCLWKIHRMKKKKNSDKLLTQADDQGLGVLY